MSTQRTNSALVFAVVLVAVVVVVFAIVKRKASTPTVEGRDEAPLAAALPAVEGQPENPGDGVTHIDQTTDTTHAPVGVDGAGGEPAADVPGAAPPTTLIEAAHVGRVEAINALIAAGADLDATDDGGRTALMAAAGAGNLDAVFALLNAGANPALRDDARRGARDYALARYDEAGRTIARVLGDAVGPPPVQDPGEK